MSLYGKKNLIELPDIKDRSDIKEDDVTRVQEDDAELSIKGSKIHNLLDNAYKKDGIREVLLDEKSKILKPIKPRFI